MKRIRWILILLLISGALGVQALASQVGTKEIDVKAKYQVTSVTPASYSIDLSWTDMTFTYTKENTRIWDPATHTYKTESTSGWDGAQGTVTVVNHSNVDVQVTVEYLPEPDTGIKGILKNATAKLKAGAVGDYAGADRMTATLTVSGTPEETVAATETKIGRLRITIK